MVKSSRMKKRNGFGTALPEAAIAIPVFLLIFFVCFEIGRALYVYNTCEIAAQAVAAEVAKVIVPYGNSITLSDFDTYANQVRFPGSVMETPQFSYDIQDSNNVSLVSGGTAPGDNAKKVVVTVVFPPPNYPDFKIPIFDPGTLVANGMIFPAGGLMIRAQATALLQYSRRPVF